jgi:hypothetical protein
MFACGLDTLGYDPNADTAVETVDRGDPVDFVVYPTEQQSQVLLYHGHGGTDLVPRSKVVAAWEADGWIVRQASVLPTDLKSFRAIVFVETGSGSVDSFLDEEVQSLTKAVERGTRLIFLKNAPNCSSDNVSNLLQEWGVPMAFDQPWSDEAATISFDAIAPNTQAMADVAAVSLERPCTLTNGGTWLVRSADPFPVAASFRPGNAGDVVLIGDTAFLKDPAIEFDNNLIFAQNLAQVVP